ncbi:hypothetical protein FHU24_002910 [Clostridium saccharobutylicum]|nr:hypothetical protein [Clostridium saccharobutylicum]
MVLYFLYMLIAILDVAYLQLNIIKIRLMKNKCNKI